MSSNKTALAGFVLLLASTACGWVVAERAGNIQATALTSDSIPIALQDDAEHNKRTVYLSVDGMCWLYGRFEVVRSALKSMPGVSELKVPGQTGPHPHVRSKGQIIQYTGTAQPFDVIATLQRKTAFKVKLAQGSKK